MMKKMTINMGEENLGKKCLLKCLETSYFHGRGEHLLFRIEDVDYDRSECVIAPMFNGKIYPGIYYVKTKDIIIL